MTEGSPQVFPVTMRSFHNSSKYVSLLKDIESSFLGSCLIHEAGRRSGWHTLLRKASFNYTFWVGMRGQRGLLDWGR